MRLSTNSLAAHHNLKFSGDDSWLARIAQDLTPANPKSSNIHGEITLRTDNAGFIHVTGNAAATATLPCDRCGRDVTIPLNSPINATFRPSYSEHTPREMALSAEDLEIYFIENDNIDIETLVNDTLQCGIPNHILCATDDAQGCGGENADDDDTLVYGEGTRSDDDSPFAILKNLRNS